MPFTKVRKFSSTPGLLNVFIMKECCILSNAFSVTIEILWVLSLNLLKWRVTLISGYYTNLAFQE